MWDSKLPHSHFTTWHDTVQGNPVPVIHPFNNFNCSGSVAVLLTWRCGFRCLEAQDVLQQCFGFTKLYWTDLGLQVL
ncbi:hypothetical protein KC19_7G079700 [Ceratodon purpureus]|uniref:Uncharacterized protein n=1 Tax=Ceratodon purpureus TaxID=3225 RepID=A0A8T0H8T4_CERPU|nr:hypothetical protein KC19_7G079700 [Ceratodon purpureus]